MADSESKSETHEESLKVSSKSATLNGHSSVAEEEVKKMNHTETLENGETECNSPQVNGDISDKSSLDSCDLPKSDNVCITNDSNKEPKESDNSSQNGKINNSTDIVSKVIASDSNDSVNKTLDSSETKTSVNNSSSSVNNENVGKDERSNDDSNTSKSEEKSDVVQSVDKLKETNSDNQTIESNEKKSFDEGNKDCKETEEKSREAKVEDDKEPKEEEVKETKEEKGKETKEEEKGQETKEEESKGTEEGKIESEKDEEKDLSKEDGEKKDSEICVDDDKTPKADKLAEEGKSPNKDKKTPKKKKEINIEIVKRVTRSSSGITKPVKYIDPDPRDIIDDDDDIRITKEVKKNEESDIEMIEESDPLAISESDVKKAKETHKVTPSFQERFRSLKQRESLKGASGKDNSNVIIIDTNTLLKGQSSISAHSTQSKITSSVSAQTTPSTNSASANIQTAIQAITGGNPAMQGLQSAYLSAIQQVLVAQGGSQVSNPHYIATLQQYYNTLGALQDDAYVIEAPSFIVPYVMEGKPVESIRDYLDRIKKEHEEEEKKKKEEERKKKEEEELERKKREEEEEAKRKSEEKESEKDKEKEDEKMEVDESVEDSTKVDKEDSTKVDKEDLTKVDKEDLTKVDKEDSTKADKEDSSKVDKEDSTKVDKEDSTKVDKEDSTKVDKEDSTKVDQKSIKEDEKMEVDNEVIVDKKEADKTESKEVKTNSPEEKKEENKVKDKASGENKENKTEAKETKDDEKEIIELDKDDKEDLSFLGRWEGYYRSALGKFFLELGLNHAQEFIQADLLKMQKRRVEKLKTNPTKQDVIAIKSLERQLNVSKEKNKPFYLQMKTCKFCSYKTESELVMERHLESPHMVNYTYKCNFCEFETRGPQVILFHTEAEHNVRGRLERAPAFFQCPLCPFEDNNKSKMTRHSFSCAKKFKADKNCDLSDWEPPAKIPKIHRGRPNVSAFGKAFDGLKMQNILPKNLGGLNINLQNAISSSLLNSAANASANSIAGRGRGRPVGSYKNITQNIGSRPGSLVYQNRTSGLLQPMQGVTSAQQLSIANQVLQSVVTQGGTNRVPRILPAASAGSLLPGLAASSSITIQSVQNKSGNTKAPQQPSISITPLPRGGSQSSGNKSATSSVPSAGNSQRPAFVICEICDGYIKDLEQLRNHMNLIHKVKIHPKMIYNRPPLNCQKCQHRFFTDQGLERHLLGTHGLVTSSMQEAANKGKDAGRCPICGKVFQWKLLNHVSRDHKMTLKPAHLSYKCTVCTATFNMYRLFENHVYSAHSVVNKNKSNESGGNATTSNSSTPVKKPVSSGSETPLKINDEITIIPQPAAKSPKSDSKASPKKDSPSMSKEITITKVGSRSSSRRSGGSNNSSSSSSNSGGGGVEVISLDDSPQKRQAEEPPKKRTRETATSKRARTSS